jgi:hypothetical protein
MDQSGHQRQGLAARAGSVGHCQREHLFYASLGDPRFVQRPFAVATRLIVLHPALTR